jgi:hypothetical protein
MKNRIVLALIVGLLCLEASLSACAFKKEADQKFGDQHFKTAISLIELHKIRFGEYPFSLRDLKFTGDWDQIALANVEYKRVGKPELKYPDEFWKGLGLIRSNVKP